MNNQTKEFIITLDQFEGPLDLLHQLIEKRKLQINTISLSRVTSEYLKHIQKAGSVYPEEIAKFIYVASILILIKSKSLLPILEYTKEEENDTKMLEQRVHLYSFIQKHVVPTLSLWQKRMYIVKPPKTKKTIEFTPDKSCTIVNLKNNALDIIQELSFLKEPPKKEVSRTINIKEIIDQLLEKVSKRASVKWNELECVDKHEKIVSFLAVLELVRKEMLSAVQENEFGDIFIKKCERIV